MLSIEAFVLTDFAMNLLVLSAAARAVGHVRWRRVLAASCAGTAYAVAAYAWLPALKNFVAQMLCLLLMAVILFMRRRKWGQWLRGFLSTAGSCLFAGGVMLLLRERLSPGSPMMTAGCWLIVAVCVFLSDGIRTAAGKEDAVLLRIATRMGSSEVEAFIDTGNRLREPLSGLPVVIVGEKLLRGLLDESCLGRPGNRLPPGFRLVRYGALGGDGEMCCFRPESVCIWRNGEWAEAQDLWVAIYPGDIPSGVDALAPPVF